MDERRRMQGAIRTPLDPTAPPDQRFDDGLGVLLDGIEAREARRRSAGAVARA